MRNPVIFADAFNKYLYHGRQVIKPELLKELDTTEIAVPYGNGNTGVPVQRYRDVLKTVMTDGTMAYCILGIENSSDIHYAIPVKNGLYDFLQLAHQVAETARSHKQKAKNNTGDSYKPSQDEFLSGFYKTDRLVPVVTLAVFYSAEPWDGPLTLRDMYSAADDAIMQYVPDYKVNLIAPSHMSVDEIALFHSSLKEVMLYIKFSKDKQKLQEITQNNKNFRCLDRQAADVICVTTNSNLNFPHNQEVVDLCAALEQMKLDSKLEGRQEGLLLGRQEGTLKGSVEAYQDCDLSFPIVVQRIAAKFNLSLQQSEQVVKQFWR